MSKSNVEKDIESLKVIQDNYMKDINRYVQALETPETITTKESITNFTKMRKPEDEDNEISFTPLDKSYQYRVDVSVRLNTDSSEDKSYSIVAKRKLSEGVVEEVRYNSGDVL